MTRLFGRAPVGVRAVGSAPQNYGQNVTLLGALGLSGMQALMTVEGPTDGDVFRAFVTRVLCPTLQRGDIGVMDNLGAHRVAGIRDAIEGCGAPLVYLPPYSPDFSPIERCWSKLKTYLRGIGARTRRKLAHALKRAVQTITPLDAHSWFVHCGYPVN